VTPTGGEQERILDFGGKTRRERDHYEDGKIILKYIVEKYNRLYELDSSGIGQRQMTGSCEHGNELLGSIE
jgi:hypothetical protein